MTVADLSPIQLYGIVMAAIVISAGSLLAIRAVPNLTRKREKALAYIGLFAMLGLPVIVGLMALR